MESGSSGECERRYRREESRDETSQVQGRGRSRGGGKHRGLQGRSMLELKQQKKRRSGREMRTLSLAGVGWVARSRSCRDERRQSSLLPAPQLRDLPAESSEGRGSSGHREGGESAGEGFGKAEDMESCS